MNWTHIRETLIGILIRLLLLGTVAAVVFGTVYASYRIAGLLATIVYAILFLAVLTLAPLAINLAGNGIPFNSMIGRGHIVLGAFAFNHHYLVQRENRWEWCPGDQRRVYIDGEWHELESGLENKSVLGWRPFGILRYKEDGTLSTIRVDRKALHSTGRDDAVADGGSGGLERAGVQETRLPAVTGRSGTWLVDLKRLWTSGVQKIGDIGIIETAEEVIERGQVNDNAITGNPTVTFFVALVLGVIVGFVYVYLMGA